MHEKFSIDLDSEKVMLDGEWFTKSELTKKIKAMVDGGDYRVARPSAALESLETAIETLAPLTVRLPPDTLAAITGAATRTGKSLESFARQILERAIAAPATNTVALSPQPQPAPLPLPLAQVVSTPAPIPLTASDAASAIPLTPKPTTKASPGVAPSHALSDAEKGWFNNSR